MFGDKMARLVAARVHAPVDDSTALSALAAKDRVDGMTCLKLDDNTVWIYDASSSAASGPRVVVPDDSTGRWLKQAVRTVAFHKEAADGSAGAATSELAIFRAAGPETVSKVYFVPSANLTADNSNYATLAIAKRDGAGGGSSSVASKTTQVTGSGNLTAFVPLDLGTVSNASMTAGNVLTVAISKTGTGVVVPAGTFIIEFA